MAKYTDIDFSFSKNSFTGDLNKVQDSTAIRQSLKNIILTLKGEKSFDYVFGGAAQNMLFEYSGDNTMNVLNDIDQAIRNTETRINLQKVSLDTSGVTTKIVIEYEYDLVSGDTVTETTTITTS